MAEKKETTRWIKNMLQSLDACLDEAAKTEVMESCGRACARGGVIGTARKFSGDLQGFLDRMAQWVGKDNVRHEGSVIHLVYPRCLCPTVAQDSSRLPDDYCLCSRGWLKEMFETVTGKPVEVELRHSIKRGADSCRFTVRL